MRSSFRTPALVLVCMVWGAALYAALFAGPREDDVYIAALVEQAEQRAFARLELENSERGFADVSETDGKRRHLNNAAPRVVDAVWRSNTPQPRIPGVDFSIREPFNFPLPHYSRNKLALLRSPWVSQLQDLLREVKGLQVSLVTASIEHRDVLLNWLISALLVTTPPLQNVVVLTLDREVFDLVSRRNISALYVHEDMVISETANVTRRFSQVHVVRLSVLRLINHYGFSVVNYDCDAIVLKNPQPIFDGHKDADIIGTFGKGPGQLYVKWGITLNTGVMLLRSNAKLEYYWELMSREMSRDHSSTDDQANINLALERLNVRWLNLEKGQHIEHLPREVFGLANNDIIVMLMPENKVCRYVCDPHQRNRYYVWHTFAIKENRTVLNKMSQAKVGDAWFLRSDWVTASEEAEPQLRTISWLKQIADPILVP